MTRILWFPVLLVILAILSPAANGQVYQLPNNNAGCPSNCRQIPWVAGSDIWNGGVLPTYTQVTCSAAVADGTTDQTAHIQGCINAAAANTAVFLPPNANAYFVNGTIRLVNNVVLRGSMPGTLPETRIFLGANGELTTQNFSHSSNLNPATNFDQIPSTFTLTGSPQKGDTTVVIGSGTVAVGTWIKIFGNDNPALISALGGICNYCGDDTGAYLMQQFEQVTAISTSPCSTGCTATLSQPIYFPPYLTAVTLTDPAGTEPAGAKYNIISFQTQKAGYEYFHVAATGDVGGNPIFDMQGCLFCWIKGVESEYSGSASNGAHIRWQFSYGGEVRDSYIHEQRSGASGAGYGIWEEWTNGNHKFENNIVRHSRHGIVWEGGGGGEFIGYNYIDDNFTDDTTYLGSARPNHGAHPFMELWEGNIASHVAEDDIHGSSSHLVFFRNNFWGDETNDNGGCSYNNPAITTSTQSGTFPLCTVVPNFTTNLSTHSILGFASIDIFDGNNYMSFVANVLGRTTLHTTWSAATLRADSGSCCIGTDNAPYVYAIATTVMGSTPVPNSTVLLQGNWDFKTNGIAYNDGGTGFTYASSLYYGSEPAFLGTRPFPLIGSDLTGGNLSGTSGKVNTNAAYDCYWSGGLHANQPFSPTTCYALAPAGPPLGITGSGTIKGSGVVHN